MEANHYKDSNIVVCAFYNPGRINPIAAIVEKLVQLGANVTCYGEASTKSAIECTGAQYKDYLACFEDEMAGFPYPDDYLKAMRKKNGYESSPPYLWHLQDVLLYMDSFLEEVRSLKPDLIFYDSALVEAVIASEKLSVPRISLISTSGPGVFGDDRFKKFAGTTWEEIVYSQESIELQQKFKSRYGVNPLDHGLPWQFYSKKANIVSLIEELAIPLTPEDAPFVYSRVGKELPMTFVGPCASKTARVNGNFKPNNSSIEVQEERKEEPNYSGSAIEDGEYPVKFLENERRNGKKVCYFSLGTVITAMLWTDTSDMTPGGAPSGKDLFQRMVENLVKAVKDMPDVIVVLNIGVMPDAPTLLPKLPDTFIVRQTSPQLIALQHADVFFTHAGAGSTQEALLAGVPTIITPGFGDQLTNGEALVRAGAGIMSWDPADPYHEATSEKIRSAILNCLEVPSYGENTRKLGDICRKSGGPLRAAQELLKLSLGSLT